MNYKINKSIVVSPHDEGGVILDTVSGKYFELNKTAIKIFNYIEMGHDIETVKNNISTEYGIDAHEALKNIKDFIETLIKYGFIEKN